MYIEHVNVKNSFNNEQIKVKQFKKEKKKKKGQLKVKPTFAICSVWVEVLEQDFHFPCLYFLHLT